MGKKCLLGLASHTMFVGFKSLINLTALMLLKPTSLALIDFSARLLQVNKFCQLYFGGTMWGVLSQRG